MSRQWVEMAAGHDLVVQAGAAAAAAQDHNEVAVGFGEQVPTVEAPAVGHHEHGRSDVDGRQGDVDHGGDSGPDRRSRGAGVLDEGGDDVGGDTGGEDRNPHTYASRPAGASDRRVEPPSISALGTLLARLNEGSARLVLIIVQVTIHPFG
ncbi:hypothetical protein AB0948_29510 [Streptomyces koyangensis]|uniref:hypothetical protein n=1 Tax=Streptomyces koyangensis TaxID=188770 RepID=UPI0034511F6F